MLGKDALSHETALVRRKALQYTAIRLKQQLQWHQFLWKVHDGQEICDLDFTHMLTLIVLLKWIIIQHLKQRKAH